MRPRSAREIATASAEFRGVGFDGGMIYGPDSSTLDILRRQVATSSTSIGSTTFVTMSIWRGFAVVQLTARPQPVDWTRLMLDDWARLQDALIAASFWAVDPGERRLGLDGSDCLIEGAGRMSVERVGPARRRPRPWGCSSSWLACPWGRSIFEEGSILRYRHTDALDRALHRTVVAAPRIFVRVIVGCSARLIAPGNVGGGGYTPEYYRK